MRLAGLLIAVMLLFAAPASAETYTWDGSDSDAFATPSNWTPTGVPTWLDVAFVPGGTPNDPTVTGDLGALVIGEGATARIPETAPTIEVGAVANDGTVEVQGLLIVQGAFVNSATVRTPGELRARGEFSGAGTVDVAGGVAHFLVAAFSPGARIVGAGSVRMSGTGTLPPALFDMEADVSFAGTHGGFSMSGPARSGPALIGAAAELTFTGGAWDADVQVIDSQVPTVLRARGFIRTLENHGTVELLGTLTTERYLQRVRLVADVPEDRLVSSGPAELDGDLFVTQAGVPVAGSRLPVVSGTPVTGAWDAVFGASPYTVEGGTLVAPPIDITVPVAVDFGAVDVGARAARTVRVTNNAGNARVELDAVVSGRFGGGGPVSLAPGASVDVPVSFSPVAPGVVEGALSVGPRTVVLRGSGNPPPGGPPSAPPGDSLLLCNGVQLTLLDVKVRGKRLQVSGLARSSYAGETVVLRSGSRTLGQTVVRDDGSFAARVRKPSGRNPRVQAVVGAAASRRLQLQRSLRIVSRRVDGDELVVRARIAVKRPPKRVEVFRQDSCSERTRVARPKVEQGRVTVRLPIREAADRVEIFRIVAKIRGGRTYTLPIAVGR